MKSILFVDDNPSITEVLEMLFSSDFKVFTASEGKEALETISKNPEISILVTDINMPNGMGGIELIKSLPESFVKSSKVFVMSGYSSNEAEVQNLPQISKFFQKPFSPKDLIKAINE